MYLAVGFAVLLFFAGVAWFAALACFPPLARLAGLAGLGPWCDGCGRITGQSEALVPASEANPWFWSGNSPDQKDYKAFHFEY